MPKTNFDFAKIVATPTLASWSQVYNAGSLFVVTGLTTDDAEVSLNLLGRDLLSNLEAEFFSLEEKSLHTIKDAITKASKVIPANVKLSMCVAFNKDKGATLYLYVLGTGQILMQREEHTAILLHQEKTHATHTILTSAGLLKEDDVLVLETEAFCQAIPLQEVTQALSHDTPEEIAEKLSPAIHDDAAGDAAAMILHYHAPHEAKEEEEEEFLSPAPEKPPVHHAPEKIEEPEEEEEDHPSPFGSLVSTLSFSPLLRSKRKVLMLALVVVLSIALIGSIFLVKSKQASTKNQVLFQSVYPAAQKDYDEGMSLLTLTPSLAQEDFRRAKQQLAELQGKFPNGSKEEQQIRELSKKIDAQLGGQATTHTVTAKPVADTTSLLLQTEKKNAAEFAAVDDSAAYYVTSEGIYKLDNNQKAKQLIKNEDDWSNIAGFGAYNGNLYLLDKKQGVLKFIAGADGYGKTKYLKDSAPDLTDARALAIDGSVYILMQNGSIKKYTSGSADTFTVSGIPTPLKNPTRLMTNQHLEHLYILDPGSSSIIQLGKDGVFKKQFNATILKDTTDLDVSEEDQKIYVLSKNTVYALDL